MITPRQIKAARALISWTTEDLASYTNLTADTITNIENGRTQPREGSLDRIAKAFLNAGVEFTDQEGVRIKSQGVDLLVGRAGLQKFFNGVYEHMKQHGGTIVQFGVDEKQFLECLGAEFSADYVKRMVALYHEKPNFNVQAIICEGETEYLAPKYNEYRWISREVFQAVPFYICGETLAIMDFQTSPAPTIVLLKFPAITAAYRKQFEAFWKIAKPMPTKDPFRKRKQ